MKTVFGEIPDHQITTHVNREKVPCGDAVTTSHFDSGGRLVRQDVTIEVSKSALIAGRSGEMK
jgi:hypothetical protein